MEDFVRKNNKILKMSNDVLCPINDSKEYKTLTLSNGLEIFFVKDDSTKVSAACVTVSVGQLDDYSDKLGIAHFLEHMLFLGSEKYTNSDEYSNFINNNGGSSNAHTATDKTWYHFSINSDKLLEALDMFAHFFIDPLFDKTFIESEVHAVNSEHLKNIFNDSWRIAEVEKKLLNPLHNASRFSTGNNDTLLPSNSEDNINELTEKVKQFYNEKYSANKMRLYLYHTNLDDEFISSVKTMFEAVTNKEESNVRDESIELFLPTEGKVKESIVVPHSDINELTINFVIKKSDNRLGEHLFTSDISVDIISDIIGHEGQNTLFEKLKNKQLVSNLYVGAPHKIDESLIMSINFHLTDKGVTNIDKIIKYTYGFINFIKSDIIENESYYTSSIEKEIIKRKINFKNTKDIEPDEYLQRCASYYDTYDIDIKYILASNILISENMQKHVESIKDTIDQMSINNSFIIKQSRDIVVDNPLIDEYYGTEYTINEINTSCYIKEKYINSFLPQIRELITEDLLDTEILENENKIIKYDSLHDICYDLNNVFNEDKVFIQITVKITDLIMEKNVLNYLYVIFYVNYLNIENNSELYDLSMNLCNLGIHMGESELNISLSSYPKFVSKMIDKTVDLLTNTELTQMKTLEIIKEQIIRNTENSKLDEPYIKLRRITGELFSKNFTHTSEEVLRSIESVNFNHISKISKNILQNGNIKCVISGNINKSTGDTISRKVNDMFSFKEIGISEFYNDVDNSSTNIINSENSEDANSACKVIYLMDNIQHGLSDWAKKTCLVSILATIIHTEYFHQLRTLGKLGYIVFSHKINMNGLGTSQKKGIFLLVQSEKLSAIDLCEKSIAAINNEIKDKITSMDSTEFINLKLGFLSVLQTPDTNVYFRMNRIMSAIDNKTPDGTILFDYKDNIIDALLGDNKADILSSGITKDDIINYFNLKFIDNPTILSLGIQSIKS